MHVNKVRSQKSKVKLSSRLHQDRRRELAARDASVAVDVSSLLELGPLCHAEARCLAELLLLKVVGTQHAVAVRVQPGEEVVDLVRQLGSRSR